MIDHPLFRDRPNVFRCNEAVLIDDEGFGNAVNPEIDANCTCPVHPVRKSLAELTDELHGSCLSVLNIHADDDHATILELFPDVLEPGCLLITGWVAPGRPEVND